MELQTFAQQNELYAGGVYNGNEDNMYNLFQAGNWENYYGSELEFFDHNNIVATADQEDQFPVLNQLSEEDPGGIVSSTSSSRSRRSRRSRRTTKKNLEEIENQRMAHIAVERNRRKQMNDYLAVLRGLMPEYYVLKGDQASIIGGAINYVKELEQQLQFLGILNRSESAGSSSSSTPFSEFFTFPQYSSTGCVKSSTMAEATTTDEYDHDHVLNISPSSCDDGPLMVGGQKNRSYAAADIEVTMVENHANLKVRSKTRPKQLLKMVTGLHNLRLTVLHLNLTTVDQLVLYSLSLKVEDDCNLASVDDIAAAVNQILSRIQEEACWI